MTGGGLNRVSQTAKGEDNDLARAAGPWPPLVRRLPAAARSAPSGRLIGHRSGHCVPPHSAVAGSPVWFPSPARPYNGGPPHALRWPRRP